MAVLHLITVAQTRFVRKLCLLKRKWERTGQFITSINTFTVNSMWERESPLVWEWGYLETNSRVIEGIEVMRKKQKRLPCQITSSSICNSFFLKWLLTFIHKERFIFIYQVQKHDRLKYFNWKMLWNFDFYYLPKHPQVDVECQTADCCSYIY